jgi:hypothetical protein
MTQDEIILMADASGISLYGLGLDRKKFIHYLESFAKLVAQHEREACAEVCKKHADVYALLEQNPHAFGTAKPAWAACIDNRDTILARGQA